MMIMAKNVFGFIYGKDFRPANVRGTETVGTLKSSIFFKMIEGKLKTMWREGLR